MRGEPATPVVEMRGVGKHFGGVRAVEGADLAIHAGEVTGLVGHNGAGKSTLIALLSGALSLDDGEIRVDGVVARIKSPRDAQRLGIETLYQNLALADNLDAIANVFLGREPRTRFGLLDERTMERAAGEAIARVNPRLRQLRVPVEQLSGGERQTVAIARAVHFRARVMILDEPTAALGPEETREVGEQVRRLRDEGLALVIVSHDLNDVHALSDRLVVMQGGRIVSAVRKEDTSPDQLLERMLLRQETERD